jgi:L-fuculose-phosphate aldolase
MHLALYTDRPDVRAVVHAHPCFATALHLACDEFPSQLTPEAAFVLGSVAMVPFSQPGTDEVGIALKSFMPTSNIFLLANHGATTVGSSLDEAFYRMHVLERTAKMWCLSKMLGSVRLLPQEVLNKLTR